MRCPPLDKLPPPPPGKTGWPWTIETPQMPDVMVDGRSWPRLSVVVASLNQVAFIEEMIRSVLLQGYPDLELMIIDGGSTDGAVDIIRKYQQWLSSWVSEPDHGQSEAFNKGLRQITGSLFNIFDTDDMFLPGALGIVASAHVREPEKMIAGAVVIQHEGVRARELFFPRDLDQHAYVQWWSSEHHGQPGLYYPSIFLSKVGLLREDLHFHLDWEFTLRYLALTRFSLVGVPLAIMRLHPLCKSVSRVDGFVWEMMEVSKPYQTIFPEINEIANREAAGPLFWFGLVRLFRRQPGALRYMREGLKRHPFWALYFVFPGWPLRRLSRLIGGSSG